MALTETNDALLAAIGIPADSSVGIDAYCAQRGWRVRRSSLAERRGPVRAHCVTIRGVWNDDGTRPDDDAALGHACMAPSGQTAAAQRAAMTQAARKALSQALAAQRL